MYFLQKLKCFYIIKSLNKQGPQDGLGLCELEAPGLKGLGTSAQDNPGAEGAGLH